MTLGNPPGSPGRGAHRRARAASSGLRRAVAGVAGVLTLGLLAATTIGPVGADTPPANSNGSVGRAWNDSWIGVYNIPGIPGDVLCADNNVHTYPTGSFDGGTDVAGDGDGSAIAYLLNRYAGNQDPDIAASIDAANSQWGVHTSSTDYSIAVSHGLSDQINATITEGRAYAGPYTTTMTGLVQHGGGGLYNTNYTGTVHVSSAAGNGVPGRTVTLQGSNVNLSAGSVVTDGAGNASFTYAIPAGNNPNYSITTHTDSPVLVQYANLNGNQPVVGYRGQDSAAEFGGGVDPFISANIIKYAEGDASQTPVAGATFQFIASNGSVLGSITTASTPVALEGLELGATYTVKETGYTGPAGLYVSVAASNGYTITIPANATNGYALAFSNPVTPVVGVTTTANHQLVSPGYALADQVVVTGNDGQNGTIASKLLGPVTVPASGQCSAVTQAQWDAAAVAGTYTVAINGGTNNGNGTFTVNGITPAAGGVGCYGWDTVVTLTPSTATAVSHATDANESTLVRMTPIAVTTTANYQVVEANVVLTDTVVVTGNDGQNGTITGVLHGPAAVPTTGDCADVTMAAWTAAPIVGNYTQAVSGTTNNGNGSFVITGAAPTAPGCYGWTETIVLVPSTATASSPPTTPGESTVVTAPVVATQISLQKAMPGDKLSDTITVTGAGSTPTTSGPLGNVTVSLVYMPFAADSSKCADITAAQWDAFVKAHPESVVAHETLPVPASGKVVSTAYEVPAGKIGCYTYGEDFRSTLAPEIPILTKYGEVTETATVITPTVTTQMSENAITDTGLVFDKITVTGLHGLTGTVSGVLLGPVSPNAAGTCEGVTYDTAKFVAKFDDITADHDGSDYVTNKVSVQVGLTACYTGFESLTIGGRVFYAPTPGEVTETVLATKPSAGAGSAGLGSAQLLINTGNPGSGAFSSTLGIVSGSAAILIGLIGGLLLLRRRRVTE